ncbi:MAG: diguanylate cyclase domain-containing protein [Acidimicrobiales bacterium]
MRRLRRHDELTALRTRVELEQRVRRALDHVEDEARATALVTDSLRDWLDAQVVVSGIVDPVLDCWAMHRHESVMTASSRQFDACAHLRDDPREVSAVCAPILADGHAVGAVHWRGEAGAPLGPVETSGLGAVAHMLGTRIALVRTRHVHEPVRVDPLTGLLNPWSVRQALKQVIADLVPFSLAVCHLDDFDAYNDTHGHDTGDRALRVFARCLTSTVRPGDIVGRTDLDHFTVVFPGTSAIDAGHALERVREALVLALSSGTVPSFTASFGVADSDQGQSIEAIVETAERAVELAEHAGTNRVVIAGEESPAPPTGGDPGPDV